MTDDEKLKKSHKRVLETLRELGKEDSTAIEVTNIIGLNSTNDWTYADRRERD